MSLIPPVFYTFRRCPYAMRARLALIVSGTKVELREILLRDKPQSFLEASPSATVPCLKLSDEHILDESLDIMLWALRQNDPENWLEPPLGNLEQMLSLIEEMDGDFKRNLDRYKYSTRYDGAVAAEHRQIAFSLLLPLEDRLAETSQLSQAFHQQFHFR